MRKRFMEGFHYDAHPMGMLVSAVAALSTFYPEAKDIFDADEPRQADPAAHRQDADARRVLPPLQRRACRSSTPTTRCRFPANFLNMMWKIGDDYEVDPVLARALDVLFILHADHEQNCGTTAMRVVGSAHADPYSACGRGRRGALRPAATAAPTRPVVRMLTEIGSIDNVAGVHRGGEGGQGPAAWASATASTRTTTRGPRSSRRPPYEVFEVTGKNPLLDIALKLEEVALERRLLHQPQAVPERRLLLGPHLPGDGLPDRHVHGAVRHPPHVGLAGALESSCSATRTRRSPGPASSTSARHCATTWQST